ncbi:MAG: hypothetical protein LUC93_03260 [Planctomycetaceae bacterium]|nr:hypothetical protein [Planctomycetaceae bacterium]
MTTPDKTPAKRAAEEIFSLIKTRLEEQLPFLQFHEAPQNDLMQIAVIIERHMGIPTEKTKAIHDAQVEFLQRELVRLDPEYFTRPRENNSHDRDPGDTEGPSRWR